MDEPEVSGLEQKSNIKSVDEIVDRLLRDKDFLLANEIKSKTEELNQMLVQAQRLNLKVEISTSEFDVQKGNTISWIDVKIYKEI